MPVLLYGRYKIIYVFRWYELSFLYAMEPVGVGGRIAISGVSFPYNEENFSKSSNQIKKIFDYRKEARYPFIGPLLLK